MSVAAVPDIPASRPRLMAEFALFFLVAPPVMAVLFPAGWMFRMLFALTAVGLFLLLATPGFRPRELLEGARRVSPALVAAVGLATAAVAAFLVLSTHPGQFLLIRRNPGLMLMIAVLYPVLSALPQELVFRALYFRRYASILPRARAVAVPLNAAVFAWAHLMYWSWVVIAMTFAGGLVFAWSYRVRRNFPEAVLVHSVAGVVLFAMGLGVFFYSGNVRRPF